MNTKSSLINKIQEKLKTVYDPEFPLIDIYTLGLIYDIQINDKAIKIIMTFTTPYCPMEGIIKEMIKNSINEILPKYQTDIQVTFDPMRTMEKIKDPDLKRMFE